MPKSAKVTVLKEGQYLRLLSTEGWEFVSRKNCTGVVIILALTEDRKVILVEQYRKPLGRRVIEFPAGLINDRNMKRLESVLTAAKRELFEEAGYRARRMSTVVEGPSSGGSSADMLTMVRAEGLRKVGQGGGVDGEDIVVFEVPLAQVDQWLDEKRSTGVLVDPKIYAGLYFLRIRRS